MIFNLTGTLHSLKGYGSYFFQFIKEDSSYDPGKFEFRVMRFPYPDHSTAPLKTLYTIATAMEAFLHENPKNIVAVHCLAGRGRTGTVVSCWYASP